MDISIIEYISFGFVAYFSFAMLILSVIKDIPTTKSLSGLRAIYLMPGVICSGLLAYSGVNIVFNTVSENVLTYNRTGILMTNATSTITNHIVLQIPFWQTLHFMLMIILIVHILIQVFSAIGKTE